MRLNPKENKMTFERVWVPEKKVDHYIRDPEDKEKAQQAIQTLLSMLDSGGGITRREGKDELLRLVLYVSERMLGPTTYAYHT